jgi:hypothetical protein
MHKRPPASHGHTLGWHCPIYEDSTISSPMMNKHSKRLAKTSNM